MEQSNGGPLDPIENLFWNHSGPGLNLSTNSGLDLSLPNYEGLNLSQNNQQDHQVLNLTHNPGQQDVHRQQQAGEEDGLDLSLQNGMNLTRQVQDAGYYYGNFDPSYGNYDYNNTAADHHRNSPLNLEQHRSSPLNLTAVQQQQKSKFSGNYFQENSNQGFGGYYHDFSSQSQSTSIIPLNYG